MRHAWGLLVIAGCYQPTSPYQPLPDASRPDAPISHPDAPPIIDAVTPVPDAYAPDAPPDAPPPPPVCGDGTRAPGEVCFGTPLTIDAGEPVYSARLLDVDGDGHRDLIYLTRTNVMIRHGNGNGTFATPVTGPATDSWWLAAGDIDGDGITDLAATGRQQLTVWFGTGGGAFGSPHTTTLYDGAVALEIADADGYPGDELYVTTGLYFYVFTWFVNDFDQLYLASTGPNTGMATEDIDGDGHIDSLVGAYDYGYTFLGTVDGATSYGNVGGDGSVAGLAIANVDSDPKPDAILALPATSKLAVYSKVQNSPEYTTTHVHASELWSVTSGTPRFVAAADLDGDGTAEVIAGMPDTMRLQLFHPGGAAGTAIQLAEPMTSQVLDGDANGDGIADLVVTLQDQIVVLPSAAP